MSESFNSSKDLSKIVSEFCNRCIEANNKSIKRYQELIDILKEDNKRIERQTRCLKDTLKYGNGIDKDYCKYLLDNQD